MPLNFIINGDTDIRSVALPAPEARVDVPFDPARDITPQQMAQIRGMLDMFKACPGAGHEVVRFSYRLAMLGDRMPVDAQFKDSAAEAIAFHRSEANWEACSECAFQLAALGYRDALTSQYADEARTRLRYFTSGLGLGKGDVAPHIKCLRANGYDDALPPGTLDTLHDVARKCAERGWWNYLNQQAADCTILGMPVSLGQREWQGMRALLKKYGDEGNWYDFSSVAANLAIIAAKEVRMTEGGLQIVPHKITSSATVAPAPAVRNFLTQI